MKRRNAVSFHADAAEEVAAGDLVGERQVVKEEENPAVKQAASEVPPAMLAVKHKSKSMRKPPWESAPTPPSDPSNKDPDPNQE